MNKFLITGTAGFIGASLVKKLLLNGQYVIGLDNLNSYYNPDLKKARLDDIKALKLNNSFWKFLNIDIADNKKLNHIFEKYNPNIIVNLAAQAGVRYSIENPSSYIQSNLVGFGNILEMCRKFKVDHLVYASSSSVYGANRKLPYSENDPVDHPVSLYAATKRSNELMAHSYSNLYGIKSTGLRFFTVYGPWGRPDMAPMIFAKSIMNQKQINIFNDGNMKRDFTYIDDIVEALFKCCLKFPKVDQKFNFLNPNPSSSFVPHRIFNIGKSDPINLNHFINILESALGKKAIKKFKPMQKGDVLETFADTNQLNEWIGYKPKTSIEEGVKKFADWYLNYGYKF